MDMPIDFGPYDERASLLAQKPPASLLRRAVLACNTRWFNTSWLGIVVYVTMCCLNYLIGYYAIFVPLGWQQYKERGEHDRVRIFGDLVTVGWFALGFVSLPWHQWEQWTCIKTRDCRGFGRFMAWWLGTIATFFVFGYIGTIQWLQISLATKNLSSRQLGVFAATFAVIAFIIVYWLAKLCPTKRCRPMCNPPTARKVVFIRLIALITVLFVVSAAVTSSYANYTYHLHHWWFGFVLIMLSTAALDNWFDYFLQGIFWTFLTETLFNYGLEFGHFFI